MTLYSRLFRRAPSEARETKEDFLTEALGHLLTQIPRSMIMSFIEEVLLKRVGGETWKSTFLAGLEGKKISWETQCSIVSRDGLLHGKRPDLVLFANRCPVLVVEAKVDAIAYEEQLKTYAAWLLPEAASACRSTAVVLLLLDQSPLPPCLTSADATKSEPQQMGHTRWTEVYQWLLDSTSASGSDDTSVELWSGLGKELAKFMTEIGVVRRSAVSSPASLADVQTAQNFYNIRSRFIATIEKVNDDITNVRSIIAPNQASSQVAVDRNRNVIWSWVWLTVPPAIKWYAAWGFYFPTPDDEWWDVRRTQREGGQFFVSIESEGDIRRALTLADQPTLPAGWECWPRKGLVKMLHLQVDEIQTDELSNRMSKWTANSLTEIWPTVQQLAASLPQASRGVITEAGGQIQS